MVQLGIYGHVYMVYIAYSTKREYRSHVAYIHVALSFRNFFVFADDITKVVKTGNRMVFVGAFSLPR